MLQLHHVAEMEKKSTLDTTSFDEDEAPPVERAGGDERDDAVPLDVD